MCENYVELCVGDCFFKIWLDFFYLFYYSKNIKTIEKIKNKKVFSGQRVGKGNTWHGSPLVFRFSDRAKQNIPSFFRKCGTIHNNNKKSRF